MRKGHRLEAQKKPGGFRRDFAMHKVLFMFLVPHFILMLLFNYLPLLGSVIAFQDFRISRGFLGSEWVWLKHFKTFFSSPNALKVIGNTLILNIYTMLWSFWVPILFAILLCNLRSNKFRKMAQTCSYLPYFVSSVVLVSLVNMLLSVDGGPVTRLYEMISGSEAKNWLVEPGAFRTIYISMVIWASFGSDAIVYIAAIVGIDPQLYEAAIVDGANSWQRMWHITLPGIRSTIVILLIMNIGRLLGSSFDLVYLLQHPLNYEVSETIATYVYRRSFANLGGLPEYSYSTAIGIFQSVVNLILMSIANWLSRKYSETSLF